MECIDMEKYNHGGMDSVSHDFSINLNPLGVMDSVKNCLSSNAASSDFYMSYPPAYPTEVEASLSRALNVDRDKISIGVGASELIDRLVRLIKPKTGLLLSPCFSEYERCLRNQNSDVIYHPLSEDRDFQVDESVLKSIDRLKSGDMFFICTPNNPNGLSVDPDILRRCIDRCERSGIYAVIDMSFLDFTDSYDIKIEDNDSSISKYDGELRELIIRAQNAFVLNTFTKLHSIPSLRIGYGFSNSRDLIKKLNRHYVPWSISTLAQCVAKTICDDDLLPDWIEETGECVRDLREWMVNQLSKFPLRVFKSDANFILFKDESDTDLISELLEYDVAIRDCSNYRGLGNNYYRIAIKNEEENRYLIGVLNEIYGENCG
jgi:threonine-phosphate decarboxylase